MPFEQVVADGRKLYLETFDEEGWPILLLEFKLYALRHKGSLARIRDLYRLLYEDAERGLLRPDFGFSAPQKRKALIALALLRCLPSAVALESQFNPLMKNRHALAEVLKTVYDAMLEVNNVGTRATRGCGE